MKRILNTLAIGSLALLTTACSSQMAYSTGQEWQKEQCRKLLDTAERQRCEKGAAVSYDKYTAEADAAKGKPAP